MATQLQPITLTPHGSFIVLADTPEHVLRCAVCQNAVWIEDLQVIDGRPVCPTHYEQRVTLATPDGRDAVVILG